MRPVALITGASSGIGAALAREFARRGHDVALIARRETKLLETAAAIEAAFGVRADVIAIDLSSPSAASDLQEGLTARDVEPSYIINNAAFGIAGRADLTNINDQLAMIDVNLRVATDLTLRFSGSLRRRKGGILNVSSIVSLFPGPGMAVYYASKAYMLSFTQAISREMAPLGVRVTALCPGPVLTELHDKTGIPVPRHIKYLGVSAERVAEEGYKGLMRGKRVVVPGLGVKLFASLIPHVPTGLLMSMTRSKTILRG